MTMSKQIALVTKITSKGLTEVLTERHSACGGCQTTHGCTTCLSSSKIKARVNNPVGARPGDVVEIHMKSRAVWQGALILYGFPLLGLILAKNIILTSIKTAAPFPVSMNAVTVFKFGCDSSVDLVSFYL
jgi:positive regulator of sigma E activity